MLEICVRTWLKKYNNKTGNQVVSNLCSCTVQVVHPGLTLVHKSHFRQSRRRERTNLQLFDMPELANNLQYIPATHFPILTLHVTQKLDSAGNILVVFM